MERYAIGRCKHTTGKTCRPNPRAMASSNRKSNSKRSWNRCNVPPWNQRANVVVWHPQDYMHPTNPRQAIIHTGCANPRFQRNHHHEVVTRHAVILTLRRRPYDLGRGQSRYASQTTIASRSADAGPNETGDKTKGQITRRSAARHSWRIVCVRRRGRRMR